MPWWNFKQRNQDLNRQLDSELRHHLESLIEKNMAEGMKPEEARRQALLEFGGPEQLKEELRDIHRLPVLETTVTNFRFALRLIRKSPGFSAVVILTLALGIGANSAVFSAIDAILLRPLPFPHSEQIVVLRQLDHTTTGPPSFVAPTRLEDWNRLNSTFQAISGYYTEDVSDLSGPIPEKVTEAMVAARFFKVWGVSPILGRDFTKAEEHFGGPLAIIISHRLWIHQFNGDPNVIGKGIRLEKWSCSVVGVMPASFRFPDRDVDVWQPSPSDAPFAQLRNSTWYRVFGRMKPDVTIAQARSNLATVQAQLGKAFPETDKNLTVDVTSLKDITTQDSGKSLWILFGAVSLLLMIACTNIAALLLARAAQREREISVRLSLGASRRSVVFQLLTECFVLALIGSVIGLFVAYGGSFMFSHYAKAFPRRDEVTLNLQIVLYSLACAIVTTLLCGLVPAIRATRSNPGRDLAQFSRTQVSGRHPLQWFLVGTQVALAVTLLVGAGLLLRSFQKLGRVSAGFETDHILTLRISANYGETTNYPALIARLNRTLEAIRATPGVAAAATSAMLPGLPADSRTEVKVQEVSGEKRTKLIAETRYVSNGYFQTMQIPLLAGESCRPGTFDQNVLINKSFADTYLAGFQPVGRHLLFSNDGPENAPLAISGVVADAREQGLDHAPVPTIYWCTSAPFPSPYFLVRTHGNPLAMGETLRKLINSIEPARSVFGLSALEQHLSNSFAERRLRAALLTAFALTAIALACTGIYGTLSYFVSIRKREVGLRLALGASRGSIVTRFLQQGITVSIIGCAAGLCLAISSSRVLSGMLFGVTATDWPTLAGVIITVLAVAMVASLLPAIRAATVEPMQVLREE